MSIYAFSLTLLVLVAGCAAQDPYDDAHECEMFRKCRTCSSLEYCVKLGTGFLYRWWFDCPFWAPYCNPYSQACETTKTAICDQLG